MGVLPRMRRFSQVISSMFKRMETLSLDMRLLSSADSKGCMQDVQDSVEDELSQYENAEVEFEPSQPLFVEPFETCAALGRIAVMDSNRLKMLGKVTGTVLSDL